MAVRRVTIGDVAALAGVHKATVSRALNEATQHLVSPETVRRVRRAAEKVGYVPNAMARGLRTSLSMTVGVIIPDLMNPIFPPVVRGVEQYLQPRGYTALLANTDGHAAVERAAFTSLWERSVDGFIIATGRLDDPWLMEAYDKDVRVVMVNRSAGEVPYPLVTGDDAYGVVSAVAHLHGLGHRDVVHVAGPQNLSSSRTRALAFDEACATHEGMRGRRVEATALTAEAGQATVDDLLASGAPVPTAVVAGNDLLALGVLRSLRAHGLRCPEDVSVVGFNDMPFAGDVDPALTTVRVPLREIGTEAAQLLLRGIEAGAQEPLTLTLPASLIVRASTGPAR